MKIGRADRDPFVQKTLDTLHRNLLGHSTEQAILALLTPPQATAWQAMVGRPFVGRLHFSPQGPPPARYLAGSMARPGRRRSAPLARWAQFLRAAQKETMPSAHL